MSAIKPYYIDSSKNRVELEISYHARQRFVERWNILNPYNTIDGKYVDDHISTLFIDAQLVSNLSIDELKRINKHNSNTLYFRRSDFTFVVCDKCIVTIEISDNGLRSLNKNNCYIIDKAMCTNEINNTDINALVERRNYLQKSILSKLSKGLSIRLEECEYIALIKVIKLARSTVAKVGDYGKDMINTIRDIPNSVPVIYDCDRKTYIIKEIVYKKGKVLIKKEFKDNHESITFQQFEFDKTREQWKAHPIIKVRPNEVHEAMSEILKAIQLAP
ncbi:hypothetical protein [Geomonas agri]|uniref:hypothetical protein n=1 Tax=Geomonas agri TaxID=2873702 RepID=UPI001CD4E28E|nr:hypothetical protein [Geomonas agri]